MLIAFTAYSSDNLQGYTYVTAIENSKKELATALQTRLDEFTLVWVQNSFEKYGKKTQIKALEAAQKTIANAKILEYKYADNAYYATYGFEVKFLQKEIFDATGIDILKK